MKKILVAGSTGYLGCYIIKELKKQNYWVRALARKSEKLDNLKEYIDEIVEAEVTKPETLTGICDGIDIVISSIGITSQKDGLTYMDVDYLGNKNMLDCAKVSNISKFIYISALNGDSLKHLKIFEAKEKFVQQLQNSGLDYCIIRPNGFFSDMSEFYHMAKKGRIYLFGNGELKSNPIHGEDLAKICVDAIESSDKEINSGGPEVLTQNEIAFTAFEVLNKEPTITHLPNWLRISILKIVRTFTGSKFYGPIEFFLTVMAIEMIAPQYGKNTLKEHFKKIRNIDA